MSIEGQPLTPAASEWPVEGAPVPVHCRRIPNMGHALSFGIGTFLAIIFFQVILLATHHSLLDPKIRAHAGHNTKLMLGSMALAYVTSLLAAKFVFPLVWEMPFGLGLEWNGREGTRQLGKLFGVGLILGWIVQAISIFISMPKSMPMDDFFRSRVDIWLVTGFGVFLAPLFEEIAFRGFLLPAVAYAFDWLAGNYAAERRPPSLDGRCAFTSAALIASALFTSVGFALLHAEQLAHAWGAVAVLFSVSVVLTFVRIRTRSVAASTVVHMSYNFSVFLTIFLATGGYRHLERMAR